MKKFFALILIIVFITLCMFSCKKSEYTSEEESSSVETQKTASTNPITGENTYASFNTVSELLQAIKYDPYKYVNQEIQVTGTLIKQEDNGISALVDISKTYTDISELDGYAGRYHYRKDPCIDITITDDILNTVADSGDYMTVYGTVRISSEKIYLDNCTYTYK